MDDSKKTPPVPGTVRIPHLTAALKDKLNKIDNYPVIVETEDNCCVNLTFDRAQASYLSFAANLATAEQVVNGWLQNDGQVNTQTTTTYCNYETTVSITLDRVYSMSVSKLMNKIERNQHEVLMTALLLKMYYVKGGSAVVPQGPIEPEDQLQQTENADSAQNTTITQAADVDTAPFQLKSDFLQRNATTLEPAQHQQLTERNVLVREGLLSSGNARNDLIFDLKVPGTIFENLDTSTATPLRPYTLMKCDVEVTIKINANQAQAGRYIMAFYPCKDQAFGACYSVYQAMQREHVELTIGTSNDGKLMIPYENLRPFFPIQANEIGGVTGGSFGRVALWCLSPVNVIDGAISTVPYQVFARMVNPYLAAMRHPLSTVIPQGPDSEPALQAAKAIVGVASALPEAGPILRVAGALASKLATSATRLLADDSKAKELEDKLIYVGLTNKDKPVDPTHNVPFQPIAQKPLAHGIGPILATKMRLEPMSNTAHTIDFDTTQTTESFRKIAQIYGVQNIVPITTSMPSGSLVVELPAVPFDTRYLPNTIVGSQQEFIPPPVTYVSLLFQGYAGEIEYEFTPIKTASHNFSILVAYVPFDGTQGSTSFDQAQSCHYKIIDFRTNDTGTFKVPYASTNLFRSYPLLETGAALSTEASGTIATLVSPLQWKDPGKVVVFIVNPLNPTPIVSPQIEMLVKVKASNSYQPLIPTAPRFQSPYLIDAYCGTPVTSTTGTGASGVVPQGPIQTDAADDIPTDDTTQLVGPQVQTMEIPDNILDVNRRTMRYTTVRLLEATSGVVNPEWRAAFGNSAYIPLVVNEPVFNSNGQSDSDSITAWQATPRTLRDATAAMFRFYRGGLTASIVNHSSDNLIITHFPPMERPVYRNGFPATMIISAQNIGLLGDELGVGESLGYATVRNVPSVNPVTDLEIPFYNTNNYLDLQARLVFGLTKDQIYSSPGNMLNAPLQDALARTLGTLKIQTELNPETFAEAQTMRSRLTIKTAIADDGKFYHFIGCPPIQVPYSLNITTNPITTTTTARPQTRGQIQTELLRSGIESNPGPVVAEPQGLLPAGIASFFTNLVNVPSEIRKVREQGDVFTNTIEAVKTKIALLCDVSVTTASLMALALVNAYTNPTKMTILTAAAHCLVTFGIITDDVLWRLVANVTSEERQKEKILNAQGPLLDEPRLATSEWLVPLIGSGLLEAFLIKMRNYGMDVDPEKIDDRPIIKRVYDALASVSWTRVATVGLILNRLCGVFTWMGNYVKSWLTPTATMLLNNSPDFVADFMIDAAFVLNEMNKNSIVGLRQCRDRFWVTLMSAYYLNSEMAKSKVRNPTLQKTVNDVIKRANEMSSNLLAPPVRFEPFVFWIYGPGGVGKSTNLQKILVNTLVKKGGPGRYEHPNPVYTRQPTSTWWNGYNGQPIVMYDDLGAIRSPEVTPIIAGEMMAIKSCAIMPIEKPRLEEKDMQMTSVLVGVASNFPYLEASCVSDTFALDRRRDVLVECDFTQEVKDYFKRNTHLKPTRDSLPPEMRENDKDLEYGLYEDPTTLRDHSNRGRQDIRGSKRTPDRKMTHQEMEEYVVQRFTEYHAKELERMAKRYANMLQMCPNFAKTLTDMTSLKLAVMQMILKVEESAETTMDTLRYLQLRLETETPQYYKSLHCTTKRAIDTLKKIDSLGGVQAQGTVTVDIGDRAKPDWIDPKGIVRTWVEKIYDTVIPWHKPISSVYEANTPDGQWCSECGKNRIQKEEVIALAVCSKDPKHVLCDAHVLQVHAGDNHPCKACGDDSMMLFSDDKHSLFYSMSVTLARIKGYFASPLSSTNPTPNGIINLRNLACMGLLLLTTYGAFKKVHFSGEDEAIPVYRAFYKYMGALPSRVWNRGKEFIVTYGAKTFRIIGLGDDYEIMETHDIVPQGNTPRRKSPTQNKQEPVPSTSKDWQEVINWDEAQQLAQTPGDDWKEVLTRKNKADKVKEPTPSEQKKELDTLTISTCLLRILNSSKEKEFECKHDAEIVKKFISASHSQMLPVSATDEVMWEEEEEVYCIDLKTCGKKCLLATPLVEGKVMTLINQFMTLWLTLPLGSDIASPAYVEYQKANKLEKKTDVERTKHRKWQKDIQDGQSSWVKKCFGNFWTLITTTLPKVFSALTVLMCVYFGYRWFTNEEGHIEPVEPEGPGGHGGSYTAMTQKTAKHGNVRQLNSDFRGPVTQGLTIAPPNSAVVAKANKIRKNYVYLKCGAATFPVLGIRGNIGMITRHNWHYLRFIVSSTSNPSVLLVREGREDLIVDANSIREVEDDPEFEATYIELPKTTPAFKDITPMFVKAYDTDEETGAQTPRNPVISPVLYYIDVMDGLKMKSSAVRAVQDTQKISATFRHEDKSHDYNNEEVLSQQWIVVSSQAAGMCLSVYLDVSGQIVAAHVAGSRNKVEGYAIPTYQERIADLTPQGVIESYENLTYMYSVSDAPYHTAKSKIIPSPLQAVLYEPVKEPCIQSKHDPRYTHGGDPLSDGVATIGNYTKPLNEAALLAAYDGVREHLLGVLPPPYTQPPVSEQEVLFATKAPIAKSMNLATSAGYPLARKGARKSQKMDYVIGDKLKAQTKTDFDNAYEKRIKGERVECVFWAHLKDELRPKEKLRRKGGTRVFHVAPFEIAFNARRVLLPFIDAYQSFPIDSCHAIGLNPNSRDWAVLRKKMLEKGSCLFQMDFKNYSDAIPRRAVELAFAIMRDYYRKHGVLTREVAAAIDSIAADTFASLLLVNKDVYRVNNGVLAGHPLTSIVNSIVNAILQAYVWIMLTGRRVSEFFTLCQMIVMGDDVVICAPDWLLPEYNCAKICEHFGLYNILCSDSKKNFENIQPFDDFEAFEFLSRGWTYHKALTRELFAPVNVRALFDCPLWITTSNSTREGMIESIQASLLLAFDHGPTFFERFKKLLCDNEVAPRYPYFTWIEVYMLFHSNIYKLQDGSVDGAQKKAAVREDGSASAEQGGLFETFLNINALHAYTGTCRCQYNCMEELEKREKMVQRKLKDAENVEFQISQAKKLAFDIDIGITPRLTVDVDSSSEKLDPSPGASGVSVSISN